MLQVDMQISNHSHQWHHCTITIKRCVLFYIPHSGSLSFVFPFFLSFISSKKPKQFISFIFLLFFLSFYYFFCCCRCCFINYDQKNSGFEVRSLKGNNGPFRSLWRSNGEISRWVFIIPALLFIRTCQRVRASPSASSLQFHHILFFSLSLSLSLSRLLFCCCCCCCNVLIRFGRGEKGGGREEEDGELEAGGGGGGRWPNGLAFEKETFLTFLPGKWLYIDCIGCIDCTSVI